jgi:Fe-S-cluster-containing hydrogenase component 2
MELSALNLVIHPEKCTGCRICEIICSFEKENAINPRKSRIRVVTIYPGIIDQPVVCKQCKSCVAVCPVGAISVNGKSEAALVNVEVCVGCKQCVNVCPFSAINFDVEKNVPLICDLCGGKPACIEWCPFDAIEIHT